MPAAVLIAAEDMLRAVARPTLLTSAPAWLGQPDSIERLHGLQPFTLTTEVDEVAIAEVEEAAARSDAAALRKALLAEVYADPQVAGRVLRHLRLGGVLDDAQSPDRQDG